MLRCLLPVTGALLLAGTLALNASGMEPLSVHSTESSSAALNLSAEQDYFMQSSEERSRADAGQAPPSAGQERHEPPASHTLLDMGF
ncbi:MAG: hypothetical protein CMN94_10500 [Synechococcus sp. EAC657]|nr:hypothetical protein [Synechococcus sp. EAC657]